MSAADLQAMHQTIYQILRDTGRRPGEIVSLKIGCVEVIDGQHNLIYDNHKAARLRRRLPITADTAERHCGLAASPRTVAHGADDPPVAVPVPVAALAPGPRSPDRLLRRRGVSDLDTVDSEDRQRAARPRRGTCAV